MKEDRIVIGTSPVSIFCNGRATIVKTPIEIDDGIHTLIVNGAAGSNPLRMSSNPISIKEGAGSYITGNTTTGTALNDSGSVTLKSWKTFQVDMEKVKEIKDVNEKLNAIFEIFAEMNMTVQEYTMTDTLKKFCREII